MWDDAGVEHGAMAIAMECAEALPRQPDSSGGRASVARAVAVVTARPSLSVCVCVCVCVRVCKPCL